MKYKNIELIPGDDSSAELLVHVWLPEDADDDLLEYAESDLWWDLQQYLYYCGCNIDVTPETERLITVRVDGGISFDQAGVDFLVDHLYKEVTIFVKSIKNMDAKGVTVKIGVHVDGPGEEFVFFDKDGNWYNEDSVTPEEFLANVEY